MASAKHRHISRAKIFQRQARSISSKQKSETDRYAASWSAQNGLAQTHFGNFVFVLFLGVSSEQEFDAREKARIIEPDFRALGIEPQQGEFRIFLATGKPRRDKSIPKSINVRSLIVETKIAMQGRKQRVIFGCECCDGA